MFIYEIRNTVNNKVYIGQTIKPAYKRWNEHQSKLSLNKHQNPHLQSAWNKYGETVWSFQVLAEATSNEELDKLEREYIAKSNSTDPQYGYNLMSGGRTLSDETRAKMSQQMTGRTGKGKKQHLSERGKAKLVKKNKERVWSQEARERVSKRTVEHNKKLWTSERRQQLAENNKSRVWTDEARANAAEKTRANFTEERRQQLIARNKARAKR